jgi:hypothetical protein
MLCTAWRLSTSALANLEELLGPFTEPAAAATAMETEQPENQKRPAQQAVAHQHDDVRDKENPAPQKFT